MKPFKDKSIIILLGPPGSGKGTQANLLSEKFGLYHLETSKVIKQRINNAGEDDFVEIDGKKYPFSKERKNWDTGLLCSTEFVSFLMKERIGFFHKEDQGFICSGSPRTLKEGKDLIPLLKEFYGKENIYIFEIMLSAERSIWRNSHRRICELMRHSILYNEETKNLKYCPLDGSKLIQRGVLDDPETIKIRLREYKKRTIPLLEYLTDEGIKIEKINGEQSVASVFNALLKKIQQ